MNREKKLKVISKSGVTLDDLVDVAIRNVTERTKIADPLEILTGSQCYFVLKVYDLEPCSLTDIARKAKISKPSASAMVNKLVNKKILIRQENPECRREVVISTTPDTKKYIKQVDDEIIVLLDKIAGKMSPEEFEWWYKISLKINEIVTDD
ncbi:MAG: MarR family transcriptional regulator [Lentisphaerae bacterium]|nr:MarR family transcriptional regulator [Lentisphaerota bacterium]MCP4102990.1 MarR family transcriptional regulator [Lentisphaerota bacterium]